MKTLKIIAFSFILTGNCMAQGTEFGLMGGLNLSNIGNLPYGLTSQSNTGYHIGGLLDIYLSRVFDIQPQLLYINLGSTFNQSGQLNIGGTSAYVTETDNIKLSYIQMPVYFVHKFGDGWNFHFGPYFGMLLTDYEKIDETATFPNSPPQSVSFDTSSTATDYKFDFGLGFGIGYQFQGGLGFSIGYSFGLANINKSQQGVDANGQTYIQAAFGTNNWYSFSLSYLLR